MTDTNNLWNRLTKLSRSTRPAHTPDCPFARRVTLQFSLSFDKSFGRVYRQPSVPAHI